MIRHIEPTKCIILVSDGTARRLSTRISTLKRPEYMVFTDSLINDHDLNIGKIERLWCFLVGVAAEKYPTIEEAIIYLQMTYYLGKTIEVYRFPPDKDEFDILHTKIQRHSHTGFFKYVVDPEYLESLGFVKIG